LLSQSLRVEQPHLTTQDSRGDRRAVTERERGEGEQREEQRRGERATVVGEQDVDRFDVPMSNVAAVEMRERQRDL
jgi:hypothetical protein